MAYYPLELAQYDLYRKTIEDVMDEIFGRQFDFAFREDECRSKESCDEVAIDLIGSDEEKQLLIYGLSEHTQYLEIVKDGSKLEYKIILSQDFLNGWVVDFCIHFTSNKSLISINYAEYLKSKEWRDIRNRLLKERGFNCERCNSKKNLQIHHLTYERLGFEEDNDLVILCEKCHKEVHHK
jgi:hypothetical protein